MKSIVLGLVLLTSINLFSQDSLKWSKDGFNYVITQVEGKTSKESYKSVINWISKNYKNPEEVILSKIENEYIRIEGVAPIIVTHIAGNTANNNGRYMIEISFKEGKYKFEVKKIDMYLSNGSYTDVKILMYKNNGNIKAMFRDVPKSMEKHFNDINLSIKNCIIQVEESSANDW